MSTNINIHDRFAAHASLDYRGSNSRGGSALSFHTITNPTTDITKYTVISPTTALAPSLVYLRVNLSTSMMDNIPFLSGFTMMRSAHSTDLGRFSRQY